MNPQHWLRLPPLPQAHPGELELRPSRKAFILDVVRFVLKQFGALFGIAVSIAWFRGGDLPLLERLLPPVAVAGKVAAKISERIPDVLPGPWTLSLHNAFYVLEGLAILTFFVQLMVAATLLKLGWEQRRYLVGEETVRLREGLFTVREQTFTVANIQNMLVRQGPIQHLLGVADLEISTAGGGSGKGDDDDSHGLHVGRLRNLDDASGVRDHLRRALESHRHAGLGDDQPAASEVVVSGSTQAVAAALALRDEARALVEELQART